MDTKVKTMAMKKRIRVGVDVGGTFTDFVLVDEKRDIIFTGKQLTTPKDPSLAICEGVERITREAGVDMGDLDGIVHGTTLVTNTLIERDGAKIGLITTEGFRDVLEVGHEMRYDLYDLSYFDNDSYTHCHLHFWILHYRLYDATIFQ